MYSLFQALASIDDIAVHLGFENISRHDSCSALIKVSEDYSMIKEKYVSVIQILPNNKDVFVSHATWDSYNSMLKVLKRYTMPLKRISVGNSSSRQF